MYQPRTRLELSDEQILKELINHYEIAIRQIKRDCYTASDAIGIVEEFHIQFGICFCAEMTYRTDITTREWVKGNKIAGQPYWHSIPGYHDTKEGILEALDYRVTKMKYILKYL